MACNFCGDGWQQTHSSLLPDPSFLAQRAFNDYANSNSILARQANFVARYSPAFVHPGRNYETLVVVPYNNNLVSAVVPQGPVDGGIGPLVSGGNSAAYVTGKDGKRYPRWLQSYTTTECGCCPTPFLPLPPQGALVLEGLTRKVNGPVQDLLGSQCQRSYY